MTIVLEGREQTGMWVLLSRRAQLKLQSKGLATKGLVKWCKANVPGCEKARTWKDCVIPVEYAIAEGGGPQDFSIVNVHVMERVRDGLFQDLGIYNDMATVENSAFLVQLYMANRLEIVYTLDAPREPTGEFFTQA